MINIKVNIEEKINNIKDRADLVTTILIIAGLSTAAIVSIGGIAYATKDNAKTTAECIANKSFFDDYTDLEDNCKGPQSEEDNDDGAGETVPDEEIVATKDDCFLLNIDGNTIIQYKFELEECGQDVIIPNEIDGIPITIIGEGAFVPIIGNDPPLGPLSVDKPSYETASYTNYDTITSVIIPDSITTIEYNAFSSNNLTSVDIPDSVTSIGAYTFAYNNLNQVSLPNSLLTLEEEVFSWNNLTSIDIPDSVTTIGRSAFAHNQLSNVNIPQSVTHIGEEAFVNNELNNVNVSDSVTHIGDYAFSRNILTSLILPDSVKHVGTNAFQYNQLSTVVFSKNMKIISRSSFSDNQLTSLNIPDSITNIESSAFANNQLTTVTIPSYTQLGYNPFGDNVTIIRQQLQ